MTTPPTNVVLVGVYGCSASGKTRLSHDLNRALNDQRPLLLPISTDHFFDDAQCVELNTYEDPQCIDWPRFVACLQRLRCVLQENASLGDPFPPAWWTQLPSELQSYVVGASTEEKNRTMGPVLSGTAAAQEDEGATVASADSSLMAHEEEDAQYTQPHTAPGPAPARPSTIYVVCEGITLFTLPQVTSLFSFFFFVSCEAEVAAVRRFLRAPRRVKNARNKYQQRILQLCAYRTAARRRALEKTFAELYGKECNPLLAPVSFFPPVLEKAEQNDERVAQPTKEVTVEVPRTEWWDAATGEPTEALMHFWDIYSQQQPPQKDTAAAVKVLTLESPTEERWPRWPTEARQRLLPQLRKASPTAREGVIDDATLLRRYAEFRYWFFFEVLYYHFLFLPIAVRNVQSRVAELKTRGTGRSGELPLGDLFLFDNTQNDNESVYTSQLNMFCDRIRHTH